MTQSEKALDVIFQFGGIDGGHHKQWVLDQVVRHLTGYDYDRWTANYQTDANGDFIGEWDTGIAP